MSVRLTARGRRVVAALEVAFCVALGAGGGLLVAAWWSWI